MILLRCLAVLAVILASPGAAGARVSSLSGSISILQEYDSNIHLKEHDEEDGWFTVVSPSLVFTSQAEQGSLSFGYAPGLRYDHDDGSTEVDHYLTLDGAHEFSPRFSGIFRENFIRSNDYTYFVLESVLREGAGVHLSGDRVRRQYWTNNVSFSGKYEYAQDSILGFGYSNRILKNDTGSLDDYVKHQPFVSVGYRLNRNWEGTLSYDYVRGDFDMTEDLEQHLGGLTVKYYVSPRQMFSGAYQFTDTRYEGGPESDYKLHRGDLGWQRNLNRHATIVAWIGASFADREAGSDETALNYAVDLTRQIKNGELNVGGQGGMDELQFTATDRDDGLSRFWSVRGSFDYQLQQHLSSNTHVSYREDNFLAPVQDVKERSFLGGLKLSYAFQRWYVISLGYSYRRLDSERAGNDYQDHRAYLELTAGKELARWL